MASTYSTSKPRPVRRNTQSDNFLEALRGLGQDTVNEIKTQVKATVTQDIPESFGWQRSGNINPNESISLSQASPVEKKGEENNEANYIRQMESMRQQEYASLARQEAEAKKEISAIREEIGKIAKSAGELVKEVEIATFQAPVNPGIYHKNFFSQLRSFLVLMRKRIQDSREWLSTTNSRASKRGYYWNQVSKSGSKYMLSSERYMVTSTG